MLLSALLFTVLAGSPWFGPGNGLTSASVIVPAVDDDHTLYAVGAASISDTGIFRSTDRGETWEKLANHPPHELFTGIWTDPLVPDRLYAGTKAVGLGYPQATVYRSIDRGQTWVYLTALLGGRDPEVSLAVDSIRPNTLYVTFTDAPLLLRSSTGGNLFVALDSPFMFLTGVQLRFAPDGALLAMSEDSLFRSQDRGDTWNRLVEPSPSCGTFRALVIDPADAERMFLGTGQEHVPCGQIFRTRDRGETWEATADVDGPVADLAVDPSHPSLVYASTFLESPFLLQERVLVSGDEGGSWTNLQLPVNTGASRLALTQEGRRLYAATPSGVYAQGLRRTRTLPATR